MEIADAAICKPRGDDAICKHLTGRTQFRELRLSIPISTTLAVDPAHGESKANETQHCDHRSGG